METAVTCMPDGIEASVSPGGELTELNNVETNQSDCKDIHILQTECGKDNITQEKSTSAASANTYVDPEAFKIGNVNIYAEDIGPKLYPVKGNVITPPIITKNLPEAFNYLPIYGRPQSKADLEDFLNNKIREYVGCDFSDEDFDKLAKYCSPEHLKTGKELTLQTNFPAYGVLPKDTNKNKDGDNLNIVKKFKLRVERDRGNMYAKKLKYRGMRLLPLSQEDSEDVEVSTGPLLQPGKDLLFRVRFYRPFLYGKERNNSRHSVFSCDVVVPGRSALASLRARVVCANDASVRLDVAAAPRRQPPATARDLFPSGFFFINNVFYVDEREGCIDYSAPIREWAKKRGLGDFPKKDMNSVRLDELVLKLGHPEVYVHQGNCEHLFTFSEVRLVGARDPLRCGQYPRHSAVLQHQTMYCTTCAEFGAKWVVVGCARVPFDPAFFCETCFNLYLYKDGQKIGDFKAYSYRGNEMNILKPLG